MGICACCRRAQKLVLAEPQGYNLQAALLASSDHAAAAPKHTEVTGDDFEIAAQALPNVGHSYRYYWVWYKEGRAPAGRSQCALIAKARKDKKDKDKDKEKDSKEVLAKRQQQQQSQNDDDLLTEVWFYEQARRHRAGHPRQIGGSWEVLSWALEYKGVYTAPAVRDPETGRMGERRRYLLLQNMFDGADPQRLRLLQVKLGATTATAATLAVESTNSQVEGFRAASFFCPPRAFESLVRTATAHVTKELLHGKSRQTSAPLEVSMSATHSGFNRTLPTDNPTGKASFHGSMLGRQTGGPPPPPRKALRSALQRLHAAEFFSLWMQPDREHALSTQLRDSDISGSTLTPCEVAAAALRGVVRNLLSLLSAASTVAPPQQWVGSSVALAYDLDAALPRQKGGSYDPAHDAAAKIARVHLFGWDKCEFTTHEIHQALTKQQREDRAVYWARWVAGVLRLAFEGARAYRRMYCPANGTFMQVRVRVWSVNRSVHLMRRITKGTVIGEAVICPVVEMERKEVELRPPQRNLAEAVGNVIDVRHWHIKAYGAAKTGVARTAAAVAARGKDVAGTHPRVLLSIRGPRRYPESSALRDLWEVHVHSAFSLPKTETIEWSNPVASVSMVDHMGAGVEYHSAVETDTGSPAWDECFAFSVATYPARLKGALVPADIADGLPASWPDDIASWELAAGSDECPHRIQQGLRQFKEAFFRPTKARRRRATVAGASAAMLDQTVSAVGEASLRIAQRLSTAELQDPEELAARHAAAEQRLRSRISELEAEVAALKRGAGAAATAAQDGADASQQLPSPRAVSEAVDSELAPTVPGSSPRSSAKLAFRRRLAASPPLLRFDAPPEGGPPDSQLTAPVDELASSTGRGTAPSAPPGSQQGRRLPPAMRPAAAPASAPDPVLRPRRASSCGGTLRGPVCDVFDL